ncbi:MAG: CRISPR-associated protein Csx11 [Actinobacteria bacterium]|nr:CRISPR-associated protein Csx11 [Actinomycetota bacterium]
MNDLLRKLEDNRTSILLAEIGAYLHDLGKARKGFVEHYAHNGSSGWDGHNFPSIFPDKLKQIMSTTKVQICNEEVSLLDFIEKHHKEKEAGGNLSDCDVPLLLRLLYAGWNGYDGMDSGLDKGYAQAKQSKNNMFISTAFGNEPEENKIENAEKMTEELYNIIKNALDRYMTDNSIINFRKKVIEDTKAYYHKFLGETRRSANDITLFDHSYSVASLYKCAIAKNILDYTNASFDPLDFNLKILSVNLDIIYLFTKGVKIGDVVGYGEKIDKAINTIKTMVEERYPLGNEIYRDTSGIYFLIPDIKVEELRDKILNKLKEIEPELMPEITVKEMSEPESNDYKFDCKNQQQIPSYIKSQRNSLEENLRKSLIRILPEARNSALQEVYYPASSERFFLEKFKNDWNGQEICPICRLRPMKENSDGCEYCLERRKGRAKDWIKNSRHTIWLDEVSDHNDRVALIIGGFILDNWLNGSFIKTMAIKTNPIKSKNPSPARIRRCWETTKEFINSTVFEDILKKYPYGSNFPFKELRTKRIEFTIDPNLRILIGSTCDINIDGIRLSPVCIDENQGLFVTTTNLQILSNKGKTIDEIALWMQGKNIKVKKEDTNKCREGFKISSAKSAETKFQDFLPYVKIYDFPDQFMALVPAYDALDIAKKILEEYKIQFSKVRDRLPFHLGIIAFHRRTPLYVAMDAGKRLIKAFSSGTKTIRASVNSIANTQHNRLGNYVKKLTLKPDPCYSSVPLIWSISYSTGDPNQPDEWHPYIRFNGSNPNRGNYSFDYTGNGDYVVHVKELRINDCINIEPSYFKFIYLESAADRFRIDDNLRPLDDIKRLDELWKDIQSILKAKNLGTSQLHAFWQEVKKRYEDYKGDSVWENFVKSSITNILKMSAQKDAELFNKLFQAVKDGLLDLCLYWNLQVRKIKPEKQEVMT